MKVIEAREVSDKSVVEKGKNILRRKLFDVLDPYIITDGDKTYFVCHGNTGTVGIVRETKYGLKPMYFYPNGEKDNQKKSGAVESFEDEDFHYFINNEGNKVVSLTDLKNHNEYTLTAMTNPMDLSPMGITFDQYDSGKDATLEYQFYVNGLTRMDVALDYAKEHFPGFIRVKTVKMALNHFKKIQHLYAYKEKSGKYYSPVTLFNKFIIGTNPIGYEPEKLISELCDDGFYTNIPDELVKLMTGRHEVYNELKEIEKAYKRHI